MPAFVRARLHFIWSTASREPRILSDWRDNLYAYIAGICENAGLKLLVAGGVSDHVHLYVSMDASHSIAEIVNLVKSNSSRWVHENYDKSFAWQTKYAVFSVSKSGEEALFRYIRNQEEHHRVKTFREELVEFLERHDVEYDARYLLE